MQTTKQPYELLVRWNVEGKVAGAHVQYRYVITEDDGSFIGESVGQAEPLALNSFPLSDVLNEMQASALADNEALRASVEALVAENENLKAQLKNASK